MQQRRDVTVWLSSEAIAAWTPRRSGRRGGQRRYSDLAIETALTLRLLYHLPLRQAEGFLHALFGMMRLDLSAHDYPTLSRRSQHLTRRLRPVPTDEGIHLVLDSTGLSIVGEGEWAAAKHGGRGRRGWRKLHLGVDQSGGIRVHTLTEETGDDATTALDLLTAVEGPLVRVTADAASDTVAVYETAGARGATVVVPVWCNKEAETRLVAGRSAAHGSCREPHPSPVSGGRRADPLSHRQMRILSIGLVGWPRTDVWSAASGGAETSSQFRDGRLRAPFRPTSAIITGERDRFRPLAPPVAVWAALCGGVAGVWPRRRDRAPWAGGGRGGERVSSAPGLCRLSKRLARRPHRPAPTTRWCVARGGGAARGAGWPGARAHGASPVRAAPDRRQADPRPRGVPVR